MCERYEGAEEGLTGFSADGVIVGKCVRRGPPMGTSAPHARTPMLGRDR